MAFDLTLPSQVNPQNVDPASQPGNGQHSSASGSGMASTASRLAGELLGNQSPSGSSVLSEPVVPRLSRNELFVAWDQWQAQGEPNEMRAEVVTRLKAWVDKGDDKSFLSLRGCNLTSLPELPPMLQELDVSNNKLSRLPALPTVLEVLYANDNLLTSLPDLPRTLRELDLSDNRLTSVPIGITTGLPNMTDTIDLTNNPIAFEIFEHLSLIMDHPDYTGPSIEFPEESFEIDDEENVTSLPEFANDLNTMGQAVARWAPDHEELCTAFSAFNQEEGAEAFAKLLDRLDKATEYKEPGLRQEMLEDLKDMALDPELRTRTFTATRAAGQSCVDRASLIRTQNRSIRINQQIEKGRYDDTPHELLAQMRSMFRIDRLNEIATRKVKSMNTVDDIEVYLAFQVKCKKSLELLIPVNEMRYFECAAVTQQELDDAVKTVKALEQENKGIILDSFIANHSAMQPVFQRFYPAEHEKAQEELLELPTTPQFIEKVHTELKSLGLMGDVKATNDISNRLYAQREAELKLPLLKRFMERQYLL